MLNSYYLIIATIIKMAFKAYFKTVVTKHYFIPFIKNFTIIVVVVIFFVLPTVIITFIIVFKIAKFSIIFIIPSTTLLSIIIFFIVIIAQKNSKGWKNFNYYHLNLLHQFLKFIIAVTINYYYLYLFPHQIINRLHIIVDYFINFQNITFTRIIVFYYNNCYYYFIKDWSYYYNFNFYDSYYLLKYFIELNFDLN